ncbi:GPI biosynthesis protein Pig-F [Heracleum sosnowskyi]|uniref:GPI biosynthesis protein Pig-F n=2 Tax=Heracleum sosnowskyi TaxID=360622 RepID=A0AAD8HCD1_9APIA|nr:GPI biosynthesis protein Pig-F [Heracleum sosnowskyi]
MEKAKKKLPKMSTSSNGTVLPISSSYTIFLHVICSLGLALAFWIAHNVYSINLVDDPTQTLCLVWVIEAPIVILLFSGFRQHPNQCSYMKAVGRGLLGLPAGAIVNALGAIALGAPVGIQHFSKTANWSILMSVFTIVPTASVFGSSWTEWQRLFAQAKPNGPIDLLICLPAHGAVIGAWFGAWPMPLDWERPWQEWPICVSFGAMAGYLVGMVISFGMSLFQKHLKKE